MDVKKSVSKLNNNPYWILFVSLFGLKELIIIIINTFKMVSLQIHTSNFSFFDLPIFSWDFVNSVLQILIVILLYKTVRLYNNLKNKYEQEINAFSVISHVRNKRRFVNSYDRIQFFRLPNETDEQLKERLPEFGLFQQEINQEYKIVKEVLLNGFMKDKSPIYVDNLLSKWYPFLSQNK